LSILFEDRIKLLLPAALYYPYKIAKESRKREPELAVLRAIVPARGTAIDVGANRGIYSYALARLVERVEAFEPNPFLAAFLRRKLSSRVRVHQLALADFEGAAAFCIPQDERGTDIHLMGHLRDGVRQVKPAGSDVAVESEVRVATLDSFAFPDVTFIKVDAEGADLAVIEGARRTILQHRPALLVELTAGQHENPQMKIQQIEQQFGYKAHVLIDGRWCAARDALGDSAMRTHNVLFTRDEA
jgi:FkbM family methyltransferase